MTFDYTVGLWLIKSIVGSYGLWLIARGVYCGATRLEERRNVRDLAFWETEHKVGRHYVEGMEKDDPEMRNRATARTLAKNEAMRAAMAQ
jgi:hypothetical protein